MNKRCCECKEVKDISAFHKDKSTKDGLRAYCKECKRKRSQKSYAKNRTQEIEKSKKYRRNHIEDRKAYGKKWYRENKDFHNQYYSDYRKSNRLKVNGLNAKRRSLIREVSTDPVSYESILNRDGMWCYLGGHIIEGNQFDVDHIDPLSLSGDHTESNLAISYSHHNRSKSSKSILEFLLAERQ